MFSCDEKSKLDISNFNYIEITYDDGWTGGVTTHVNNFGHAQQCEYQIISRVKSAQCYVDTLRSVFLDSIIYKIENLSKEEIDLVYDGSCEDCGAYYVVIGYADTTIRSDVYGIGLIENEITDLAQYVDAIKIDQYLEDSIIIFETTKKMIPPSPPETFTDSAIVIPDNH